MDYYSGFGAHTFAPKWKKKRKYDIGGKIAQVLPSESDEALEMHPI